MFLSETIYVEGLAGAIFVGALVIGGGVVIGSIILGMMLAKEEPEADGGRGEKNLNE